MPPLKLLAILAHPDDESLGMGGTLAKYAAEGIETYLVTATRGERGWFGAEKENPGLDALGKMREAELRAAARVLKIREVNFLNYIDGQVARANPREAIAKIVGHVRRIRPHVALTFGPEGAYGHPDHIAVSQFATTSIICAADPNYLPDVLTPHRVSKLYYMAWTPKKMDAYQSAFGELVMKIDGVERRALPWPEWLITTIVDTAEYAETVWQAISAHQTQLPGYGKLQALTPEHHRALWGTQEFYRAISAVNGGTQRETDLFAGLR
ncbi:MAG: PIG-L family deacetylase [Chloroflexi bacterium]|nr:PIG-L family deacetylase [Chloroflexota bacterium]